MDQRHGRRTLVATAAAVAALCLAPAAADAASGNFLVTSNADTAGTCPTPSTCASLRQAINSANATTNTPGTPDTIGFSAFGLTITPASQLPAINSATSIAGGTIELNGASAGAGVDGLRLLSTVNGGTISGLTIDRFSGSGIDINGADNVTIGGTSIGTSSPNQDPGLGNGGNGITIHGGATITHVGTVGPPGGNTIAGNGGDGVNVDATSAPTIIDANQIGLENSNNIVVGNAGDGVDLSGPSNSVGEPVANAGNTISGNGGVGVRINGPSGDANSVLGNMIGVDSFGSRALGNGSAGVSITGVGADNNRVGDVGDISLGNTISANGSDGVQIFDGASGNSVVANRIGTNAAGTLLRSNRNDGVNVNSSPGNTIGGSAPGAGNVISGNLSSGIDFENTSSSNNVVQGNRIGTNAAGTLALPNESGIQAEGSNAIGGSGAGEGNLVSGNVQHGIVVQANGASSVRGNLVGTNAAGTGAIPNGEEGIDADQTGASVGGPGGAANTVAFNLGPGIRVERPNVVVAENSVFSNGGLGIDIDPAGVTPGTAQPLPAVATALASGGQTIVRGTVASAPNSAVTLRFSASPDCDPSGFGEGRTSLGAATVNTNAAGSATFDVTLPAAVVGQQVTATATGPTGTSEFSFCRAVEAAAPAPPAAVAPHPPVKPAVTAVTQSVSRWRAGSALANLTKAKPPVGTTFGFTLNESASVRFDFTQRVAGRKVGRRCVAQTRANRRKPKCTRTISAGTLTLSGHAGKNRVRFQGRLSRTKKLKPGSYSVAITATASGLRSTPRSLSFSIVNG